MIVACDCGSDHIVSKPVADLIAELGTHVRVTVPLDAPNVGMIDAMVDPALGRTWRVPRVWIATHGLVARELPELAERHGWERVSQS